jgi:hypothetical protein
MQGNAALVRELRRLVADEVAREPEEPLGPADLEWQLEILGEVIRTLASQAFSLDWDSGGPGAGAGTEVVYRLAGKYLYLSSTYGWTGPFDTLDEAYGDIFVSAATQSIWCSEWSEEEVIARMTLNGGPPVLHINGNPWPFETLEHRLAQVKRRSG